MNGSVAVVFAFLILVLGCSPARAWKQDQFLITFWCPPPATDEALSAVAAENYNLTWSSADGLETVRKHGLKALLEDPLIAPEAVDNPEQAAKLDALIKRVKDNPALEGYFITDEPGSGAFAGLGKLVAFIRERDPAHFSCINLFASYAGNEHLGVSADAAERARVGFPSNYAGVGASAETIAAYREHLRTYIETVRPEMIGYDHYHFLKKGDGIQYFLNLELIREASLNAKLPFLSTIQANTINPSWRLVNKHELRFLIYTTLAYGGRGISYFSYWGPKKYNGLYQDGVKMPLASDVADLNAELKVIGPQMLKLNSIGIHHTAPLPIGGTAIPADAPVKITGEGEFALGLFGDNGRATAFMVVNRAYRKHAAARLALAPGLTSVREFDRKTGAWKAYPADLHAGRMVVDLAPGDGRLFRYSAKG